MTGRCTVNDSGDLAMTVEARPFIGQECEIVKTTKAGLILVALVSDPKQTMAFPKRNIDLITTS